ncbi:Pet127-domain-containing protein [Aureobasidium pullulans]|nr:Pet127-domain-containing protein [Aureobasidium pullulans]
MPSWRSHGVRPLRPLFTTQFYVCPPCRLRLFSATTSRPLRHSTRLLDAESDKNHNAEDENVKPTTPEDNKDENVKHTAPEHASEDNDTETAADIWPFVKGDLKESGNTKTNEKSKKKPVRTVRTYGAVHEEVREKAEHAFTLHDYRRREALLHYLERTNAPRETEEASPESQTEKARPESFQSLVQPIGHDEKAGDTLQTISNFFKSSEPSSAYDGGAIQSLKDAMLSIKSDPISIGWNRTPRRLRTRRKRFVNSPALQTPERVAKAEKKRASDENRAMKFLADGTGFMEASTIEMERLHVDQPPVPRVQHGLDRVLFTQGVYPLQDSRSKVFNFDPYLQKIMPVTEFDYDALSTYKTSSQDSFLSDFAKKHGKKYVGSTSSMTSTLSHFHYLLSSWRKINISMFSKDFPDTLQSFTALNRAPTSIFLRRKGDTWAVDADKEFDGANVLMLLGRSMEKLMTMPTSEFEKYRKGKSDGISEAERNRPESFHYSSLGDFLLRSQLDAQDDRLPGTGMFDLKTRAVLPIRMQSQDHEPMTGYEIVQAQGQYESFEREYYDMMRSTALKYSLQARMGHMDGIFVAYHNVKRIFGFQYISLNELDRALHGQADRTLGNQEFGLSISLLNEIFNKATEKFPDQSIRFHFETKAAETLPIMQIFAEPMSEEDIETIQNSQKAKIAEWERALRDPTSKSNNEESHDTVEETNEEKFNDFGDSSSDLIKSSEVPESPSETTATEATRKDGFVEEIEAISEKSEPDAEPEAKETRGPLLGMTLTVRSKVNGVYVERPEFLRKNHDWTIDYSLTEMTSEDQAWHSYKATKARRKKVYNKINKVDKSDPDSSAATYNEAYIGMLKELSEKGSKMRARLDKAAADKPKIVVGMPYVKASESHGVRTDDVRIESVDDYLTWLYAEKAAPVEKESPVEQA